VTDAAHEFTGLPIHELIAGPLVAACDAQVLLANATADFIRQIGFLPPPPNSTAALGDVRTALFQFDRPYVNPADPTSLLSQTIKLEVPLLAIVNVPALSIKTVDVVFDMEVKSSTRDSTDDSQSVGGSLDVHQKWPGGGGNLHIQCTVSSHQEHTRSTDTSAKYHIELHAEDTGMPEGLSRVMDILQSAIVPPPPPALALPTPTPTPTPTPPPSGQ
jgi:hypothetical protein